MKFNKLIIIILIVFFNTETIFSENDLFNVNNIQLEKKDKISQNALTEKIEIEGKEWNIWNLFKDESFTAVATELIHHVRDFCDARYS